jgi:peptidyl-prolyl cis-trans isomerase B (cyclophilin B)
MGLYTGGIAMSRIRRACALLGAIALVAACGVEARDADGGHTVFRELRSDLVVNRRADPEPVDVATWAWPRGDHPHAFIEVEGLGTIQIELFPELAPETVENFEKLAAEGFYDGTTFHRVIPGFMVQGGDANSRNDDPRDDGAGGPGYTIPDEFSNAPHVRGAVSMANTGAPDSQGSQFFIVHADSQHLDHDYSLFGRVVSGIEVVDQITEVERDAAGRWGPKDRPIESIRMTRVWVAPSGTAAALAETIEEPADAPGPAAPAP